MKKMIYSIVFLLLILWVCININVIYSDDVVDDEVIDNEVVLVTTNDEELVEESNEESSEENSEESNMVFYGKMTGYGPDCYGCSGYLAYSGIYVGNGNIYYDDYQYGKVRIVAGDKSIPFGSIVRINDSLIAIVLDRGGAIGFGKYALFDLLFPSEKIANEKGILIDAKFEILRSGF